jgi:tetratricopeptide (TPR) repeat protein
MMKKVNRKLYLLVGVLPLAVLCFLFLLYPEWFYHVKARFYNGRAQTHEAALCYLKAFRAGRVRRRPPASLLVSDFLSFATEEMLEKEPGLADGLIFLAGKIPEKHIFERLEAYGKYLRTEGDEEAVLHFTMEMRQELGGYSFGFFLEARRLNSASEKAAACDMYAEAVKRPPFFMEAALFVAQCYSEAGRYEELIRLLEPQELEYRQNFELLSAVGHAYFRRENFTAAARILEMCVKLNPGSVEEMRLLGECGLRLGREDYADLLRQVFEMNNHDEKAALAWAEFMASRNRHDVLVSFFSRHVFMTEDFQKIYYQALRQQKELDKLGEFLETAVLKVEDYPEIPYFRALYQEKKGNYDDAKAFFYSCISNDDMALDLKKDSFNRLFELLFERGEVKETLSFLQQWIRFDPSNSELYLKVAAVYEKVPDFESALREILTALAYFPGELRIIEKAAELLLRQNAPFRLISLLSDFPRLYHHENLVFLFCKALMQTGDQGRARLVLEQYMSSAGIEPAILEAETENEEQSRFLEIYTQVNSETTGTGEHKAGAAVRDREKEFLGRLQSFAEASQEKNTLPPPLGLSKAIYLRASLKRSFGFKGKTRVYLPKGAKVEFMELPPDMQEFLGVGSGEFCLARYRGKLHRLNRRYLKIIQPQRGEAMGEAYIADIDGDYEAIAEIEELFDKGTEFDIMEAGSFASDRMIKFDDENYVKFFSIPKSSYTLRRQDRVYFHFLREPLQIMDGYDFLREEDFADILQIPAEQRLVLFGPDDGGVSLFHDGTRRSLFKTRVAEKLSGRYRGLYDRLFYRGYLILDVNNDGVLDYLSLWQSRENRKHGFLHILSSVMEGGYQDAVLLTTLDFLPDYNFSERISILHFLRDLNEDGILEFIVHDIMSVRADSPWSVPYSSIYSFETGALRNVSRTFPVYMREEKRKLKELELHVLNSPEMTNSQLAEWDRNYNAAMEQINKLLRGEI